MKWVRAALIALIIFIAASSFSKYQAHVSAQRQRQELLTSFTQEIQEETDASKFYLRRFNNQGGITVPPNNIAKAEPNRLAPEANKKGSDQVNNYKVIGRIQIDKIRIDYPIIDTTNADSLNISVTWFCGSGINKPGNCIIAGHNMKDGSLFGNLKKLAPGDPFKIYDSTGSMQQYRVFKTYSVEPTDLSPLDQETDGRKILTLITCSSNGKQRLIVKGLADN